MPSWHAQTTLHITSSCYMNVGHLNYINKHGTVFLVLMSNITVLLNITMEVKRCVLYLNRIKLYVNIKIVVIWVVMPCFLLDECPHVTCSTLFSDTLSLSHSSMRAT